MFQIKMTAAASNAMTSTQEQLTQLSFTSLLSSQLEYVSANKFPEDNECGDNIAR